jgi:hypothetical protein
MKELTQINTIYKNNKLKMKYLQTFESIKEITGTLGKMYSGRFRNVLLKQCDILNNRGIEYDIFVDKDPSLKHDLVYILIHDEYKNLFYDYVKIIGFKPINISKLDFDNLEKFDTIIDYLSSKKLDENKNI